MTITCFDCRLHTEDCLCGLTHEELRTRMLKNLKEGKLECPQCKQKSVGFAPESTDTAHCSSCNLTAPLN